LEGGESLERLGEQSNLNVDPGVASEKTRKAKRIPKATQRKAKSTPKEEGTFDLDVNSTPDMNDRPDILPSPVVEKPKYKSPNLKENPWLDPKEAAHLHQYQVVNICEPDSIASWNWFLKHG
jgi:hypothetical protein